jgi:hypothetical protein
MPARPNTVLKLIGVFWNIMPCNSGRQVPLRKYGRKLFRPSIGSYLLNYKFHTREASKLNVLVPANEHGYFVASWWRTPSRHPPKVNSFCFQHSSGIHAPVRKRKGWSLSGRSPAPTADSFHVATTATKNRVLNLRKINRNNTHTALVSVLTY